MKFSWCGTNLQRGGHPVGFGSAGSRSLHGAIRRYEIGISRTADPGFLGRVNSGTVLSWNTGSNRVMLFMMVLLSYVHLN
jgi:hypothetical protein